VQCSIIITTRLSSTSLHFYSVSDLMDVTACCCVATGEAADRAMQEASARCSSAAIPGTSSSLLVAQDCLPQQLQQQDGQGRRVEAAVAALRGSVLQRRLASFRLHR